MRALVVYESMFGNTQEVAMAIASGLSKHLRTDLLEVGSAPYVIPDDVSLVVVGGPTHAFSMSRASSRHSAAQQAGIVVSRDLGQREWIDGVEADPAHVAFATFDTRLDKPRFFWGSAARAAKKHLARRGLKVLAAQNFYVRGPGGPVTNALIAGELERAIAWGEQLALAHHAPAAATAA